MKKPKSWKINIYERNVSNVIISLEKSAATIPALADQAGSIRSAAGNKKIIFINITMKSEILPNHGLLIEEEQQQERKSEIMMGKTSEQLELKQETKECLLKENKVFNNYLETWTEDPQFTKYGVEIPEVDVKHLNQIPKIFKIFVKEGNCLSIKIDNETPGISTALLKGIRQPEKAEETPDICSLLDKYIEEKEITPRLYLRDVQNKPGTISVTLDPAVSLSKDSGEKNYTTPASAVLIFDREILNKIPHEEGVSTISEITFKKIPISAIKGIHIGKEHAEELIKKYKEKHLFAGGKTIEEIVIPHNYSEEYQKLLKEKEEYLTTCVENSKYYSSPEAIKKYTELKNKEWATMKNYRKESLLKIISFLIPELKDIKTLLKPKYRASKEDVCRINECLDNIKKEKSKMTAFTSEKQIDVELKRIEDYINTEIREIEEILFNAEVK